MGLHRLRHRKKHTPINQTPLPTNQTPKQIQTEDTKWSEVMSMEEEYEKRLDKRVGVK